MSTAAAFCEAGLAHFRDGRHLDARACYQQALGIDAEHNDALYKSGIVLHKLGRNEEAIACLDLGDGLLPNHAPTLRTRAWVLYCLKRFEESATDGRRAHQLDPDNAEICNNLGLSLRRLGSNEEALAWF